MSTRAQVTVVGVPAEGCAGLGAQAVGAVAGAGVLVGGRRQLAFFPQFEGERIVLAGGLVRELARVEEAAAESQVCVLASGDPLFHGVGGSLIRRLGSDAVRVLPAVSSMQQAFARAGIEWSDASLLSVHGRPLAGLSTRLRRRRLAGLFTGGENTPARVARHLLEHGHAGWRVVLCEDLGLPDERVRRFASLHELAQVEGAAELNVLVLERADPTWAPPPLASARHEDEFAKRMPKRGLITKREVRALSLSQLRLREDSLVWDVGAGSGAVAVECAEQAERGHVWAVEVDPEGQALCAENARSHGVDNLTVVAGAAPAALADLPDPDAVFVGGSKGALGPIVDAALARLRPAGRLVINTITLENNHEAYEALRVHGIEPDLVLLQVSRGVPLARYLRLEAHNPIHVWAATRTEVAR